MRWFLRGWHLIYIVPLLFVGLFYVYPLLTLFDISLRPDGNLDLSAFIRLFSTDYYIGTLLFTIYQAMLSTASTLILALPCAYIVARYRFAGKSLLLSLATLPFVLPTVVVALAFMSLLGRRGSLESSASIARPIKTKRERLIVGAALIFMCLLLFTPLLALIVRSLWTREGLDVTNFLELAERSRGSLLFIPPIESIWNSLRFALLSMFLALGLGIIASFMIHRGTWLSRIADPLFMLPLATSAVTLGFGFVVALDEPPLNLRASWLIIPISHTLVALPFVIRSLLPALRAIPPSIREAAQVLGARPRDLLLTIDFPLINRGIAVGATFAFTVSMGEFGASLFIAQRESVTMPVVIYRLIGDPGLASYRQALAMSVMLMLVCAIGFVVIERVRAVGTGEF